MEITISQKRGRVPVTIIYIKGEVDSSNHQEVTAAARNAIETDDARYLLLDLSACGYMSSAGIRAINEIYLLLQKKSQDSSTRGSRSPYLKLLNPSEKVSEVLSISGVGMFLETHPDLETAIASF